MLTFVQQESEEVKTVNIKVAQAKADAVYTDTFTNTKYTGKELLDGISVETEESRYNSRMWYFVEE